MLAAMAEGLPSISHNRNKRGGARTAASPVPHPKFEDVTTSKEQFKAYDGFKKPVKASTVIMEKRKQELVMTKADEDHYRTTMKSSLDVPVLVANASGTHDGGARQKAFKPKNKRVHTTPYGDLAQTTNTSHFAKPEAKNHRTERKIPETTAGASLGGAAGDINAKTYFTTTNRDLFRDKDTVMRDTQSPEHFRAKRIVPPVQLKVDPKSRLEGCSSYKDQFPKKVLTDEDLPKRSRSVPPHVTATLKKQQELRMKQKELLEDTSSSATNPPYEINPEIKDTFRSTSALAHGKQL